MKFKYKLKRMNVVKVTNEEDVRDKLIAQGFELIEEVKKVKKDEELKK
jgi:hypothetical protein